MLPITPGEEPRVTVVVAKTLTGKEDVAQVKRTDVARLPDGQLLLVTEMSRLTHKELAELTAAELGLGSRILTSASDPELVQEIEGQIRANKDEWQQQLAEAQLTGALRPLGDDEQQNNPDPNAN